MLSGMDAEIMCSHCELPFIGRVAQLGGGRGRPHTYCDRRACRLSRQKVAQRKAFDQRLTFLAALKDGPCADCGGRFPRVAMDFDHVRGEKLFEIGNGIRYKAAAVLAEIEKCEVVCSNCHRVRTEERRTKLAGTI